MIYEYNMTSFSILPDGVIKFTVLQQLKYFYVGILKCESKQILLGKNDIKKMEDLNRIIKEEQNRIMQNFLRLYQIDDLVCAWKM